MHLRESILVALDTLWAHKLRSFLTLLGIIVSIWTLVAVVSLVQGVNGYVAEKVARLGSNVVDIQRFSLADQTDQSLFRKARRINTPITQGEFDFLRAHATLAVAIAGEDSTQANTVLKGGGQVLNQVRVVGVTANILPMEGYDVLAGRFLSHDDTARGRNVAFIGADVASHLYAGVNPLGQSLTVDGQVFEVIGEATVQGNVFGMSQDDFVDIPLPVFRAMYGTADSLTLHAQAPSPAALPAMQDQLRMLLRSYRHLPYRQPDNFGLEGSDSILSFFNKITGVIAAVMIGVSAVFLVVGGIVIMNIMLAAVTERTREVGIRKAIGARRHDILLQFLVESAVLSTVGGLLGILLAWVFTLVAAALTPLPFSLPWGAVALALAISTTVGVFFGIYPAQKAAKLEPIAALRAEA